jgi:hypothetical protein
MARQTKRIAILNMIENVNRKNRESTCSADVRQGWNALLEDMLHATGNYSGFGYYSNDELPASMAPGVRYETNDDGVRLPAADMNERFRDCDDTRRFYYAAPGIR